MKRPITRSCIVVVLEKQIVRRTSRVIRVRKLMCLLWCQDTFAKVASNLSFTWGHRALYSVLSCWSKLTITLTRPNSQRPRRLDTTRRSKALALGPWVSKSVLPRLVMTSNAIANKANMRDQALICAIRAFAKPSHHLASRKPSSQPKRRPYSLAAAGAAYGRLLTKCQMPQLPLVSRARLLDTQRRCGQLSQYDKAPKLRCRSLPRNRS